MGDKVKNSELRSPSRRTVLKETQSFYIKNSTQKQSSQDVIPEEICLEIIEYFENDINMNWVTQIESSDWSAAKLLSKLLQNKDEFLETLGENGKLFILKQDDKLVAFATLTQRECIRDDSLHPWIGFVFTRPEYRGNKYSKRIIEHACNVAKQQGYHRVYIATEHAGELYKKYGFLYKNNMLDVFGVENQVFYRDI